MAPKPNRPTQLELTILRALWDQGPGSVREIQAALNTARPTGYTTVLKKSTAEDLEAIEKLLDRFEGGSK
jgi:hypothetical protein